MPRSATRSRRTACTPRSSTASAGAGCPDERERPPLASVESVREELRRLGYLDSSLDRFVLRGNGRDSLRASVRAAARVGLVAGLLFGLAATLAGRASTGAAGRTARPRGAGAVPRGRLRRAHGAVAFAELLAAGRVAAGARRERTWRVAWASPARRRGALRGPVWRSHLANPACGTGARGRGWARPQPGSGVASLARSPCCPAGLHAPLPPLRACQPPRGAPRAGAAALFALVLVAHRDSSVRAVAPRLRSRPHGAAGAVLAIDGLEDAGRGARRARRDAALAALLGRGAHARCARKRNACPIVWTTIATAGVLPLTAPVGGHAPHHGLQTPSAWTPRPPFPRPRPRHGPVARAAAPRRASLRSSRPSGRRVERPARGVVNWWAPGGPRRATAGS